MDKIKHIITIEPDCEYELIYDQQNYQAQVRTSFKENVPPVMSLKRKTINYVHLNDPKYKFNPSPYYIIACMFLGLLLGIIWRSIK